MSVHRYRDGVRSFYFRLWLDVFGIPETNDEQRVSIFPISANDSNLFQNQNGSNIIKAGNDDCKFCQRHVRKAFLEIVDKNGQPTGKIVNREIVHKNGIWHRTAHLWLAKGRLYRYEKGRIKEGIQ